MRSISNEIDKEGERRMSEEKVRAHPITERNPRGAGRPTKLQRVEKDLLERIVKLEERVAGHMNHINKCNEDLRELTREIEGLEKAIEAIKKVKEG